MTIHDSVQHLHQVQNEVWNQLYISQEIPKHAQQYPQSSKVLRLDFYASAMLFSYLTDGLAWGKNNVRRRNLQSSNPVQKWRARKRKEIRQGGFALLSSYTVCLAVSKKRHSTWEWSAIPRYALRRMQYPPLPFEKKGILRDWLLLRYCIGRTNCWSSNAQTKREFYTV